MQKWLSPDEGVCRYAEEGKDAKKGFPKEAFLFCAYFQTEQVK